MSAARLLVGGFGLPSVVLQGSAPTRPASCGRLSGGFLKGGDP
jgi:hypothetical protein